MYGRTIDGKTLTFEPSGALKDSALVMRDRETDSWWSLMTSQAIGGQLDGHLLEELPGATKVTWAAWRSDHPDTLVLSIDGREHEPRDAYAAYLENTATFRDVESRDRRLPAKEPIYAFTLGGRAYAVPHAAVAGGALFELEGAEAVFIYRGSDAPSRASSRAFRVADPALHGARTGELAELVQANETSGFEAASGFDTFWYVWIAAHPDSRLLGVEAGAWERLP